MLSEKLEVKDKCRMISLKRGILRNSQNKPWHLTTELRQCWAVLYYIRLAMTPFSPEQVQVLLPSSTFVLFSHPMLIQQILLDLHSALTSNHLSPCSHHSPGPCPLVRSSISALATNENSQIRSLIMSLF